jgi:AAA+ ATPase superfamily predicted ATPase
MFIGRKQELESLQEMFKTDKFECAIIYGRRRVGKTTLIKEFVKGTKTIFYTATQSGEQSNLERFSRSINLVLSEQIAGGIYRTFEDAFLSIASYAKKNSEPLILVIDEFPYLARASEGMSSILQSVIDNNFLYISNLTLILSGSSMSFMEKQVLSYESPLYGRRTRQYKIKPFSLYEARDFFPKMNAEEFLTIYGLTGGIPLYLSMIDENKSLKENILNNFFQENTFLIEEPNNFLKQELRTPAKYNDIIEAIARGENSMNAIAQRVGLATGALTVYLGNLVELGIIEKLLPLGVSKSKLTNYKIVDGLFYFWYKFVPKYGIFIENENRDMVWDLINKELSEFTSVFFERVCLDWIRLNNGRGEFRTLIEKVGNWWGNDPHLKTKSSHEIDILGYGLNKEEMIIGECKWTNKKIDMKVLELLEYRATFFPQAKKELFLFSKSGYTDEVKKVAKEKHYYLISYEDVLKIGGVSKNSI